MKSWFIHIGTFVMLSAVAGFLFVVCGIMPIKASSGHWPITEWFLTFAMSRSVSTHSIGIEVPSDLNERALVMKGAGHFETGCAMCHGSPVWERPRVAQRLRPIPPPLSDAVAEWTTEELFYIVKHGVLFTGMPAFPSQDRDDEVWAVVAFLLQFPRIDEAGYRELVYGNETATVDEAPHAVIDICARCHAVDGQGRDTSAFPRLDGLHSDYFLAAMQAYSTGKRHSGIMEPIAGRMSDDEVREIAAFYSRRRDVVRPSAEGGDTARVENEAMRSAIQRGELIAQNGLPEQGVGACFACHRSNVDEHNPNYPVLQGQFADYLSLQLTLFKRRQRGGSDYAKLMHPIADGLTREQAQDVAIYYESLRESADATAGKERG